MKLTDLFSDNHKPNLLFIITDQERQLQHWPDDFGSKHLPAMTRLKRNGISFSNAFTPTCMCSPSRATFLTSQYPSVHGVTSTGSPQPKHALPLELPNLARVLTEAGYATVEWQGKWHLGNTPLDYGFTGWNPPDAGNYLVINDTLGGGTPNNDERFLQHALEFLQQHSSSEKLWALFLSFVNPHDVYVSQYNVQEAGYSQDDLHRVKVPLPKNCNENLKAHSKPRAQHGMSWHTVTHKNSMQDYCNFYAYLYTRVDSQILQVLETLDDMNLTDDTLIVRFADHGEQALSHGLVEKFYNVYEESIHIPFIVSNPKLYPNAVTCDALVSLLDLLPTVASLAGTQDKFEDEMSGKSLVPFLLDDSTLTCTDNEHVLHFTYDDIPCKDAPSIIRCIRTREYKYAVYFTDNGSDADWELYHLTNDVSENENVAGLSEYASIQFVLDESLQTLMRDYSTFPSFEWPPNQTTQSRGGPPPPQL